MTYIQSMARAIHDAATANSDVLIIGDHFGGLSLSAREQFNAIYRDFASRVMNKPISELALAGAAIGAALAGSRPIIDFSAASFMFQAFPQIIGEAANIHYMTGGQSQVPVTFCARAEIRGGMAAQHSHRPQAMLANIPGLRILMPSCAQDAYGMLRWSLLESRSPVLYLIHSLLFEDAGEVDADASADVGRARIVRQGDDVTIVSYSIMVRRALEAAESLARRYGVSAEVVDLRSISPLDRETVVASASKTGHVVVADECHQSFGVAAEVVTTICERQVQAGRRAAVARVATPDIPIPFSSPLEEAIVVTPERIAEAVLVTLGGNSR